MKTTTPFDSIVARLQTAQRVLLVTHAFPDGDALGSQLGLGFILEGLGKEVHLYAEAKANYLYEFLPGIDKLSQNLPPPSAFDCVVALDCGDRERLGKAMAALLTYKPLMVIDHHKGHENFGDVEWVLDDRSSTGDMVYDLAIALGAEISQPAAYCLYTAIVTDTGSFKYSSTTAETFRVAAALVAKGVKPAEVAGKVFDNFTVSRLHLLQLVLATLELHGQARIAVIHVTREMLQQTGACPGDTESFINYPRALASVKVAVFIKEAEDGMVGVSLRSKGSDCDVAEVAATFGGGGHRNAAGFKIREVAVAEIRGKVLALLLPLVSEPVAGSKS